MPPASGEGPEVRARRARPAAGWLVAAGLAIGCGSSGAAPPADAGPPRPARWHVAGGMIRDPDGRAVVLRGLNVSGQHKWKPYFDYHQPADYARIRDDWGMNSVRLLVVWAAVEPARGVFDDGYLEEVALRVGWARAAGLHVVVDMHQDLYGEGFLGGDGAPRWTCDEAHYAAYKPVEPWMMNYNSPEMVACYDHLWQSPDLHDEYARAWARVAARLAGDPAVLGFDVMNEPFWGSAPVASFEHDVLGPFYEKIVAAVRKPAPGWLAFAEPCASRNLGIATSLDPFRFSDAVYSPHSYDGSAETGQGFNPAGRDNLVYKIGMLRDEADALGAALWIGEYGGNASHPGIAAYMDAEGDGAAAARAGQAYWHYGKDGGYGLLDTQGVEKKDLVAAIVRPYPERIAGDPSSWSWDEATSTFTLAWRPDATVAAPTVISVPPRVYPGGFDVVCDGCAFETAAGVVRVGKPPRGEMATVVVRPKG